MRCLRIGSMILEAAITMPLFVIIVFVIIQMSFVWVAKEVTHYAAYCGARAALVYNPADYAPSRDYGVVKKAAMTPLSWISWSLNASSDWSNFKIGWTDVPLNENGRELAHVTGKALAETHFDAAFSSPLMRAFETARIILSHNTASSPDLPITIDERSNISFG